MAARIGAAVVALAAVPFVVGDFWAYQLGLFYLYAIAALGLGRVLGARRLPAARPRAFLRALRLPLGARADRVRAEPGWLLLLLPLARCASGLLAFAIGVLVFRQRGESGPYFSMITLALALLAYQLANNWESVTGGFNGLKGIPGLPGLDSYTAAYAVAATALVRGRAARRLAQPRAARRALGGAGAKRAARRHVRLRHQPAEGRRLRRERRARRTRRCDLRAAARAGDAAARRLRARRPTSSSGPRSAGGRDCSAPRSAPSPSACWQASCATASVLGDRARDRLHRRRAVLSRRVWPARSLRSRGAGAEARAAAPRDRRTGARRADAAARSRSTTSRCASAR